MLILSWKMLTFYWEILTDCLRKGKGKVLPRTQHIAFFFHRVLDITTRLSVIFEANNQNTTMTKLDSILKKQRHYFVNKVPSSQSYGFSNSHLWMWELDYKESWEQKYWCFWTLVLEKTLQSPLDCKEIKPVNPGFSPEYSLKGLTLKLKLQYFGHLMRRIDSFEKTLMLGKIEGERTGWQRMR